VIVDGCGSWPYVPSLRSVCFLQTKHTLAPSFLDLAGGSLLAIYCACNVTDCKYAFNQPNEESRSKELDTNTRSRKLELTTANWWRKAVQEQLYFNSRVNINLHAKYVFLKYQR
jgi:hypothetical protein